MTDKIVTSNITLGVNMDPELKQMFSDLSDKIDKLNENIEKFNAHQINIEQCIATSSIDVDTLQNVFNKAFAKSAQAVKKDK